ncbi:MAG: C40 family peptidase [Lachnospiraceae bacterium]
MRLTRLHRHRITATVLLVRPPHPDLRRERRDQQEVQTVGQAQNRLRLSYSRRTRQLLLVQRPQALRIPRTVRRSRAVADRVPTAVVTATRTAIVAYAKQFLGNKYVYGGTSLTTGADCSGFTQAIFAHFGITTGRTSRDQAQNVKTIPISSVQPGDLLFYGSGSTITHVAIYIGDGKVIHSSNSRTGVIISRTTTEPRAKREHS